MQTNLLPNVISSPPPPLDMSHQIQSPPPSSSTPDSSQMSQMSSTQHMMVTENGMPAIMAATTNMLPTDPAILMQLQRAGSVSLLSTSPL